jgi:hypothetical protein
MASLRENTERHSDESILDKAREALNQFIQFTGREL